MEKLDIYIKDEGYAAIKFLTLRAKVWAHASGYSNTLRQYGKFFCKKLVWYPGMKEGLYNCGIPVSRVENFIRETKEMGLIIKSEI